MKPGLPWRPQDAEDARVVGYMPRRASDQVWNQPNRKKCVAVLKTTLASDIEIQNVNSALLVFRHAVVQSFLTVLPFLPFQIVIYSLCHCMLDVVCILTLQRVTVRDGHKSETLNFGPLNSVKTFNRSWELLKLDWMQFYITLNKAMGAGEWNVLA